MSDWTPMGNPHAHAKWYRCNNCGRQRSISNRSERYQRYGEPEPCDCTLVAEVSGDSDE